MHLTFASLLCFFGLFELIQIEKAKEVHWDMLIDHKTKLLANELKIKSLKLRKNKSKKRSKSRKN